MAERKRGPKQKDRTPTPLRCVAPPPGHLSLVAKEHWYEVTSLLDDAGLLSKLDRFALEIYCSVYARWIEAQKELAKEGASVVVKGPRGGFQENPWYAIAIQCQREMRTYLDRFGLTPEARSKLKVIDAEDSGKWAGLVGG